MEAMRKWLVAAALLAPAGAMASTAQGGVGALGYTASNFIVGQTSTSVSFGGGNPIYFANIPKYSGVVTLLMNEGAAGVFVCTGALLANRVSIVTAGHCVSHGAGTPGPISTTAYFPAANASPDSIVALDPTSTAIAISRIRVDPLYTGQTVDQNDLAVLTLSAPAPVSAMGYDLYAGNPVGQDYNTAGYGEASTVGGALGANTPPGLLRQGTNTFDFTFGDPLFRGYFAPGAPGAPGTAADAQVLLSDFDDGTTTHDSSCFLAGEFGGGGSRFCNLGTGATEVGTSYGDSGAPDFIDGKIAGIDSFGLSFSGSAPNGEFGELDGSAPTAPSRLFILSVPEPSTWTLMMLGFGALGARTRRSRRTTAFA